jgi:hypothetical protein
MPMVVKRTVDGAFDRLKVLSGLKRREKRAVSMDTWQTWWTR